MPSQTKTCQNCQKEFTIAPEDFAFYEKIKVPLPSFCPECREQRRLAWRNERALYKRKCGLCGKEVVSRVSPDKSYPMYCQKCWWSDNWDPMTYGRDYNFSKPFFEQFKELLFSTPHLSLLNANSVKSEWVNQETDDKNCYLNVGGHFNEDSAYNTYELESRDCFDNFWIFRNELCYENVNTKRCYKTFFSQDCFDCQEVVLCFDCRHCSNCFGCAGLRHKQYYIFNKPYSKENYQEFLKKNPLTSYKNLLSLKEKTRRVWLSVPHRPYFIIQSINSWGNSITNSKNARNCWYAEKIEDSKHLYIACYAKDCYDCSSFAWGELCYEAAHGGGFYNSKFFLFGMGKGEFERMNSFNVEYCYSMMASQNCFGCANLRNKEYCILNKQYSKEEYEELVPKIKKQMAEMPYISRKSKILNPKSQINPNVQNSKFKTQEIVYCYGEFFPPELSPFGYNETAAQDYFPLMKEQAIEQGYPWSDYESKIKYQFSDYQVPDDIKDVKDDVLEKILKCQVSGKGFRIIPMELEFYRRLGLPLSRRAPLQRHKDRMALLPPRKLFKRKCQKCGKETQAVYAPDRPETVYCEVCYKEEVA